MFNHLTTHLQNIVLKTYMGTHRETFSSVVQLEIPEMYGPYVSEDSSSNSDTDGTSVDNNSSSERLYVEEVITAILQSLAREKSSLRGISEWTWLRASSTLPEESTDIEEDDKAELEEVQAFRESETNTWISRNEHEHLGNAHLDASYIETFGVPRMSFPCSSKCESVRCTPSVFDEIVETAQEATDECEYVLYIADFSVKLDSLKEQKTEDDDDESVDSEDEVNICRVAFVSGKSRLVRNIIRAENGGSVKITKELLLKWNGKLVVNDWRVVWLLEDDISTLSVSDNAYLQIDPASFFASSVTRAMYTQAPAFMKATMSQLNETFSGMTRSRIGRRTRKVRRPGTNVYEKVTIPSQKSRKVLFLAKEPKPKHMPRNLTDFVNNAEEPLPAAQVEFYRESERLIFSNYMRPKYDTENTVYDSGIPYQWVSPNFYVHDLTTKHSQEFRCNWYKEYLSWGGGSDSILLSLAYIFGRGRLMDRIDQRDEDSTSWIPLMDPEYPGHRLRNARGWELFLRIQE